MVFRNNIFFYTHCEKQHLFSTAGLFVPQSWVSVWYSFLVAQVIFIIIYCRHLSVLFCFVLFLWLVLRTRSFVTLSLLMPCLPHHPTARVQAWCAF